MIICKSCGYEFKPNEGLYNTPSGIFCCSCYDKPYVKKKVWDNIRNTPPLDICMGRQINPDNRLTAPKSYVFVRIVAIDNSVYPNWFLLAKTKNEVYHHFEKYCGKEIENGVRDFIRNNDDDNLITVFGNSISKLLKENVAPCTTASHLENETLLNRYDSIDKGHALLLTNGMQYMGLLDGFKIIQTRESSVLQYPDEIKPTKEEIIIKRWDDGTHYYAKIGSFNVVDDNGNVKWTSYRRAMEEALKMLNKLI